MFGNNYGQPYWGYNTMQRQQPQPQPQQMEQYAQQYPQQYMKPQGLQGKVVDSLETVKRHGYST